jgi:tRNA-modifying protein YgfZ
MGAIDDPLYASVKRTAGFRAIPAPGYIRITGEGQIDFLNRQTTNDLNLLTPDSAVVTVLTSPTAKILDVLTVFFEDRSQEQSLGVLCLPGRAARTTRFLNTRIFFMDRVVVEDVSNQFCSFEITGPLAGSYLGATGYTTGQTLQVLSFGEDRLRILHKSGPLGEAFQLVAPVEAAPRIQERLINAGIQLISDSLYEILRIEAGLPSADQELNEEYTPLEMKLDPYIANNKGCYTGQEIIARQLTYDKVTRKLTGLRLKSAVEPGSPVYIEAKHLGDVTSFAHSPEHGFIALAVLKRPFLENGTQVSIKKESDILPAWVAELPF